MSLEFSELFQYRSNTEPESIFILDGAYTVQKGPNDDNSLFLPGTPLRRITFRAKIGKMLLS